MAAASAGGGKPFALSATMLIAITLIGLAAAIAIPREQAAITAPAT